MTSIEELTNIIDTLIPPTTFNKNEKHELTKLVVSLLISYVEENPFGEEKEEHSLDWYTQAIETTLQMGEPEGSIALMDDLLDHLSLLFSIIQKFPKKRKTPLGFQFNKK